MPNQTSYYALLGLHPSASAIEIRRAYRELSKRYHPDTTDLSPALATAKFQELNEAYATLSNPERRLTYDLKIGYSRLKVIQPPPDLHHPVSKSQSRWSDSAYLDPIDRPLSAGEIFALFILGLTFLGCLLLAIAIGLTRGDTAFQPIVMPPAATAPAKSGGQGSRGAGENKEVLSCVPLCPSAHASPLNGGNPRTRLDPLPLCPSSPSTHHVSSFS